MHYFSGCKYRAVLEDLRRGGHLMLYVLNLHCISVRTQGDIYINAWTVNLPLHDDLLQ